MSIKKYAQIQCSLLGSKKLRNLNSFEAKWAYICVHLSSAANYLGIFEYPVRLWQYESGLPQELMPEFISDVVNAGLIEYDFDEEVVRVKQWFKKKNGPENGSSAIGMIGQFHDLAIPRNMMFIRSAAEFSIFSLKSSLNWPKDAEKLRAKLLPFLKQLEKEHKMLFFEALWEIHREGEKSIFGEIIHILPDLEHFFDDRVSRGCADNRREENIKDKIKNNIHINTKTARLTLNEDLEDLVPVPPPTEEQQSKSQERTNLRMPFNETKQSRLAKEANERRK